jgi:hypothetical protein
MSATLSLVFLEGVETESLAFGGITETHKVPEPHTGYTKRVPPMSLRRPAGRYRRTANDIPRQLSSFLDFGGGMAPFVVKLAGVLRPRVNKSELVCPEMCRTMVAFYKSTASGPRRPPSPVQDSIQYLGTPEV